ncbi:MAG: FkbM family methyltransferase [Kiritimatiellae bacterium]|nr:FkbM family methyltransferase [Kiritimatiellia bacterium]
MKAILRLFQTFNYISSHPLNKKTGGGLLRWFRWQLGTRILPYGIVVPFVEDTRLILQKGMFANYYCGVDEFEEMFFLLHFLRDSDVFADVGANIGSYTVLASGVCGAKTYCFEPCSQTYKRLCDNIVLNEIGSRVQAYNLAMGASKGEVLFTQSLGSMNHVAARQEAGTAIRQVNIDTLDSILGNEIPRLLKIDVEGFETEVIMGADRILASENCEAIVMEFGVGSRLGYDEFKLYQKVLGYGFRPCSYSPDTRKLTECKSDAICSGPFVKNVDSAASRLRQASAKRVNGVLI